MSKLVIATLLSVIPCGGVNAQVWPTIDCSSSRITVPDQVSCWQGPPMQWTAHIGPGNAINFQCIADHGSTVTKTSRISGFVKYNMLQRGSDAHCVIGEGNGPMSLMQHMNHVTSGGTGWSGPDRDGDRYFASFRSPGGNICRAFVAYGASVSSPYSINKPWYGSETFYQYRITGYVCGTKGSVVNDTELQAYIGTVHIRTQ
jgi:hypothetical protein